VQFLILGLLSYSARLSGFLNYWMLDERNFTMFIICPMHATFLTHFIFLWFDPLIRLFCKWYILQSSSLSIVFQLCFFLSVRSKSPLNLFWNALSSCSSIILTDQALSLYHRIYRLQEHNVWYRLCRISCSHIFKQLFVTFLSVNRNEKKNTMDSREALR
jgi:hypothetical protein